MPCSISNALVSWRESERRNQSFAQADTGSEVEGLDGDITQENAAFFDFTYRRRGGKVDTFLDEAGQACWGRNTDSIVIESDYWSTR